MSSDHDRDSNATGRKSKPLMEKMRRARINDSLMQLKCLVLEATSKNISRNSKLEKADILEMTVTYLKGYYRSQKRLSAEFRSTENFITSQYRYGFNECISQVASYISDVDDPDCEMRSRLLNHLTTTSTSAKGPVKRYHPATTTSTTTRPTPYPPPHVDFQTRQTHRQTTRETQARRRPLLPSSISRDVSPPAATGLISQPFKHLAAQQPVATVTTNVPRIVSGIPVGFTSSVTGEFALILPQHSLNSTGLKTHLIPVYADDVTSEIPSHITSVRLPSSSMSSPASLSGLVFPILGSKDLSSSSSSLVPAVPPASLINHGPSAAHASSTRKPFYEKNSEVPPCGVPEAEEMPQLEEVNDSDRVWRPW